MTEISLPPLIYIIAGEASGDMIGARLMKAIQKLTDGQIRFAGVGGPQMHAEGLHSLFPMDEIALMGFAEIVPHIPRLLKRINETAEDIRKLQPRVLVTIDSPGFCMRLVSKLQEMRRNGTRFVHYVAPSVWAYRPERADKIARLYDHLMCLLPFEPEYFKYKKIACSFVGHPVITNEGWKGDGKLFRERHAIAANRTLLCLLPGSRRGEVSRHMPIYGDVLKLLSRKIPGIEAALVVHPSLMDLAKQHITLWPVKPKIVDVAEKGDAFAAADAALAKSGTVTLELALAKVPMVITYKVNMFSAWLLRRMTKIKFYNLLNLVKRREIIPEKLQENARAVYIADALLKLLTDPEIRITQIRDAQDALAMLSTGSSTSPSEAAAKVVIGYLN